VSSGSRTTAERQEVNGGKYRSGNSKKTFSSGDGDAKETHSMTPFLHIWLPRFLLNSKNGWTFPTGLVVI
jgi:hypothetical protein